MTVAGEGKHDEGFRRFMVTVADEAAVYRGGYDQHDVPDQHAGRSQPVPPYPKAQITSDRYFPQRPL